MAKYSGKTVADILKLKKANIKNAPLEKGSPSWDDIMHLTWEEVQDLAKKAEPGFRTIHKLLTRKRFDK